MMLRRAYSNFYSRLFSDGATIVAVTYFVRAGIRFASNLILTRLLYPEAFGLMSIIGSVLMFLTMLSDVGYHAFFIRHRSQDPNVLDTVWSVKLIRSFILAAVIAAVAYPVSLFYGHPELFAPLLVIAVSSIIGGFDALSMMVAQRNQRFFKFSIIEVVLQLSQTIVTIVLAVIFRSYWALVFGSTVSTILGMIFSYTLFPNSARRFAIDRDVLRELWGFSRVVLPSSAITLILTQSDKLIIAKLFDIRLLGIYAIATTLTAFFNNFASRITNTVLFARFSEANRQAPHTLREVYYRERSKLLPKYLLLCGFIAPLGTLIFQILYDPRYLAGGLYFSILMAAPVLRSISMTCEQALIAKGQIRAALEGNIARLIWFVGLIVVLFHFFGFFGVLAAVASIDLPPLIVFWWRLRKEGLMDIRREMSVFLYLLAGLALGIIASYAGSTTLKMLNI